MTLRDFPDVASGLLSLRDHLDGPADRPVGVGVSGGGDSVALLLLLWLWGQRPLEVFCVDHGLNPDSVEWTKAVERLCATLGVGFTPLRWLGDKPATGVSAAARRARHHLILSAARAKGIRVVGLGHNADDGLEAGVMRGMGSNVGAPKLWAPAPFWPQGYGVFYLRPLISVRRARLRQWLEVSGVGYIDDPANNSVHSLRARARLAIDDQSPLTDTLIGERPSQGLVVLKDRALYGPLAAFRVDRAKLTEMPLAEARFLLSALLVCAGGGERLPRNETVEAILNAGEDQSLTLCGARLQPLGADWLICREAGEWARQTKRSEGEAVARGNLWDGRFVIRDEALKGALFPLRGVAKRLNRVDREKMADVPAAVRASLPVLRLGDEIRLCTSAETEAVVEWRLQAALGLLRSEADIISLSPP